MSNGVLEQHVKRRVRVKPLPRSADFREFNKGGSLNRWVPSDLLGGSHQKTPKWAHKNSLPGIVQRVKPRHSRVLKTKRRIKKETIPGPGLPPASQRLLGFLFSREGLFPLPRRTGKSVPLSSLIAAALAFIVSLAVLNWRFPVSWAPSAGFFLKKNYLGAAPGGGEVEENLASYAGLYSSEFQAGSEDGEEMPLDLMETFSWREYKVKAGDTLSEIAGAQDLSLGTLIACNSITNARRLREGEILRIPNLDGVPYTVKTGDSLSSISASSGVPLAVISDVNNLESDVINPGASLFLPGVRMPQEDIRLALGESFIYPVRGILSSSYGWRIDPIAKVERFHSAIDLAAPQGTPVRAAMDGRVSSVAVNSVYGLYIILTHSGGYQSLYAHLSASSVKQGAAVTQGSKIGEVGSSGYSTGPHLHFGVFKNSKPVNPLEVLQR
jgi:murein DD-endopeptidase MepM/ murein hydrolase activator NlpD